MTLHQEIKIKGKWHHYSRIKVERDYALFKKINNVRKDNFSDEEIKPMYKSRGFEKGWLMSYTFLTQFDYSKDKMDNHSHGYLYANSIQKLGEWIKNNEFTRSNEPAFYFGYLFENNWNYFLQYKEDYPEGIEEIRFIFWFDN